jgi:F-type H+-transporting ATPase subunit b
MTSYNLYSAVSSMVSSSSASKTSLVSGGGVVVDFDITLVAQIVLFFLLFLILKPILFSPMLKLFEEREKRIDGAKNEARLMFSEADAKVAEYDKQLAEVKQKASEEREKLRADGQRQEQQILSKVRADTNSIVEEGKAKISVQAEALRVELGAQTQAFAKEIASQVLGREVQS